MQASSMDPRSIKYLKENGITNIIHNPKRISKKMLGYFDSFVAVDSIVLTQLNALYPKYINKFYLATSHVNNINLIDPYNMNDQDYTDIMHGIKLTSDTINLHNF